MLAVLGAGWVQTRRSEELVLRGEAALLVERVAREVRNQRAPFTDEVLRDVVLRESRAGLVYVAAMRGDDALAASSSPPPPGLPGARELRPGDVRRDGNGAWARSQNLPRQPPDGEPPPRGDGERRPPGSRGPGDDGDDRPPREDRPQREPGRPPSISLVVKFEPRLVGDIDHAARATLAAGVAGAFGLVLLGLLALRLLRRNEESLRRLEEERRLASLGTMSAIVAHELRNPLAALKGHAQLLVEALGSSPREKAQAQRVVDGAWRLERLSGSLLELARTGDLLREPVAPAALVRATVEALEQGRVRVDDVAAPATWSLDAQRFQHVVANLVDNALQAAPGRPVELRVAAEGGRLVVEVRDHGPGVPPADRERLFEPVVTTRAKGVGLGLAVARQVAAMHGGTLTVRDAPGGGAIFRVEVPPA